MPATPFAQMRNVHKWYGKVHAVRGVDFTIYPGEIVGLLGDNGAGKSTLIKMLSGYHQPDKGEIEIEGQRRSIKSPAAAMALGIETVYQEQALVDCMSVARNFFMGREPVKWRFFLARDRMKECMEPLAAMQLSIKSPDILVRSLSGGEKQGTAIGRAMYFKAKLVILDAPTRALAVKEVERILDFVRGLKEAGIAVIFITHTLDHAYSISDRFVVMDKGEVAYEVAKDEISLKGLTDMLLVMH
jgi:simple sugar transport system ATP-binding protein